MIYYDILKQVKTVDQAEDLNYEIDILLKSLFDTQNQAFEITLKSVSSNNVQMIKEALKNNFDWDNKQSVKDFLNELKDKLQKFRILKLSLAFTPSEASIDNLFNWVLKNLGEGCILDIEEDKTILGGTIIEFGGKYRDFSLKKKLEETFASKKEEIMTNFKRSRTSTTISTQSAK